MTLGLTKGLDRARFRCENSFLDGFDRATPVFWQAGFVGHELTGPGVAPRADHHEIVHL